MHLLFRRILIAFALPGLLILQPVVAEPPPVPPATPASGDVTRRAMSLLKTRCGKCHGSVRPKGELELLTLGGVARGGESGEAVVSGKPEESLLWQRIRDDDMPPENPLPKPERLLIRRWIAACAPGLASAPKEQQPHWAFRRLHHPRPPEVRDRAPIRTPVDRFIVARLEAKGLALNRSADRSRLIRRVSFDLTGLPPTREEIEWFANDRQPGAYERMVERYLGSSAYGQRWGGHWLDTAGYADSNGYFQADTVRPSAALVKDLNQRGLLESTIVMWVGEFGYSAVEDIVNVHDLHATLLHTLGLDHRRVTFPHDGRPASLSDADVTGAKVLHDLLA